MQNHRMKKYKLIPLMIAVAAMLFVLAGCGGSDGVKKGEEFTLGDNKYKLESAEIKGSEVTVNLLVEGKNAPVIINGLGGSNTSMASAVNMTLGEGEDAINVSTVKFDTIDEVDGFGVRMAFKFTIPSGSETPTTAVAINNSNKEETVKLDLASAGLK